MSETLRDLVVSLSLQTDNLTRNIRSVQKQIAEAEGQFRLAAEMVVHATLADPGPLLDGLGTGSHVSALPEERLGAGYQSFSSFHNFLAVADLYIPVGTICAQPVQAKKAHL